MPHLSPSRLVNSIRSRRGFALIVAIALLGFIILLVVTLNTLTNVETVVAESSASQAQAREYAKQAMQEAIGKLQRYAGPDTRVTTTGEILNGQIEPRNRLAKPAGSSRFPKANDSFKRWTLVWDSGEKTPTGANNPTFGRPLAWLVSGNSDETLFDPLNTSRKPGLTSKIDITETARPPSTTGLNRWIMLVSGRNTASREVKLTGKDLTDPLNAVYAELEEISEITGDLNDVAGTKKLVGRKAWWVGDLGVKAKINIVDRNKELGSNQTAASVRTVAPQRSNPAATKNFEAYTNVTAESLAKAITFDTLQFVEGAKVREEVLSNYYHDFTADGYGVAADVRNGGLKIDLNTALLAKNASNFMPGKTIFKSASGSSSPSNAQDPGGPLWDQYRSFYQYRAPEAGAKVRAQTNKTSGIYPVLVTAQMFYAPSMVTVPASTPTGTPTYRLFHHGIPAVVLWNPYNVALDSQDYSVCFLRNTTPATGGGYSPANQWLDNCTITIGTTNTTSRLPDPLRARIVMQIKGQSFEPGQALMFSLDKHISYELNNYQTTVVELKPGYNPLGFSLVCGGYGSSNTYNFSSNSPTYQAQPQGTRRGALELYSQALTLRDFNLAGGRVPANEATTPLVFIKKLNTALETGNRTATFTPVRFPMLGATQTAPGSMPSSPLFNSEADFARMYGRKFTMRFAEHSQDLYFDVYANNQKTIKTRWVANNNIRSAIVGRRSVEYGSTSNPVGYFTPATFLTDLFFPDKAYRVIKIGNSDEPYVGFSDIDGPTSTSLFEIPSAKNDAHFVSLGQLMHANLSNYSSSNWLDIYQNGYSAEEFYSEHNIPSFALGNSLGDLNVNNSKVEVVAETTEGYSGYYVYDWSWKLNDAMWDKYFFSSYPLSEKLLEDGGRQRLPNGRMVMVSPNSGDKPETLIKDFQQAAAGVLVDGAFNVNSTSVEAWKALLSSFFGVAPDKKTPEQTKAPYAGMVLPVGNANPGTDGIKDQNSYNGYRVLSAEEIDFLAKQIVVQVKKRGPFLSLSDFVNRSYTSVDTANPEIQRVGALHAALDTTEAGAVWNPKATSDGPKLNKKYYDSKNYVIQDSEVDSTYWGQKFGSYGSGSVFEGIPGYLTQGDLLYHLAPVIAPRSDAFVVRSYAEVRDPQNPERILSRAWCEAVVQRTTDYIDVTAKTPDKAWAVNVKDADLPNRPTVASKANKDFGRRFVITSFRWLSPDEI